VGATFEKRIRKKKAHVTGTIPLATEPSMPLELLHPALPMDGDIGRNGEDHRNNNDMRIGARSIDGIYRDQISQHSFLYGEHGGTEEEEEKDYADNDATAPSTVAFEVARVVDEDQLLHELLSRRQHDVVHAENVVAERLDRAADGHDKREEDERNDKNQFFASTNIKRRVAAAVIVVIVIAVVVTAVLISHYKQKKQQPASSTTKRTSSPTIAPPPTAAPVSLLDTFRSEILNQNISSSQDLEQKDNPRYQALQFLATENFLTANAPVTSVVDRYILLVLYYADNGVNWRNQSGFLSFASICAWHNFVNTTGAFCTTTNELQGKFSS
jgi:hypothetical protein